MPLKSVRYTGVQTRVTGTRTRPVQQRTGLETTTVLIDRTVATASTKQKTKTKNNFLYILNIIFTSSSSSSSFSFSHSVSSVCLPACLYVCLSVSVCVCVCVCLCLLSQYCWRLESLKKQKTKTKNCGSQRLIRQSQTLISAIKDINWTAVAKIPALATCPTDTEIDGCSICSMSCGDGHEACDSVWETQRE